MTRMQTTPVRVFGGWRWFRAAALAIALLPNASDGPVRRSTSIGLASMLPRPSSVSRSVVQSDLFFEPNVGQGAQGVDFLAVSGADVVTLSRGNASIGAAFGGVVKQALPITITLQGARREVRGVPDAKLPGIVNYLSGDPSDRHTHIPTFARVRYAGVYAGIDVVFYGSGSRLEYDFVIAPEADPDQIALRLDGVQSAWIDERGDLLIDGRSGRSFRQHRPVAYQTESGERQLVDASYRQLDNGTIGFALGAYDRSRPLIVDPVITLAQIPGVLRAPEFLAVDRDGSMYVSVGPFSEGGQRISKFDSDGTLIYSSHMSVQNLHDLQAGNQSELYLIGSGAGPDPIGAFSGTGASWFAVLAADGATFTYATRLPTLRPVTGVAVDGAGAAYICTGLRNSGGDAAEVYKIDPSQTGSASLVFLAILAGASAYDIAVDAEGYASITGFAGEHLFTVNAYQSTWGVGGMFGEGNAFVARLNPSGSTWVFSTYLGGDPRDSDFGTAIAADNAGNVLVGGEATSQDFPTLNAVQPACNADNSRVDGFAAKFTPAGALVFSTCLGSAGVEAVRGVGADQGGNVYAAGITNSADYPPAIAAVQSRSVICCGRSPQDVFVVRIASTGDDILFSTPLGGNAHDELQGFAVDRATRRLFFSGSSTSHDFPLMDQNPPYSGEFAFLMRVDDIPESGAALMTSTSLSGSGFGTVMPPTIAPLETQVDLTAAPGFDSTFGGWNGHPDCADASVTLSKSLKCEARFVRLPDGRPLDFDGDRRGDVFVYDAPTGGWAVKLARDNGFADGWSGGWSAGWTVRPADFNGDGLTDLFLYGYRSGHWYKVINTRGGFSYFHGEWSPSWNVYVVDMNADQRSDVFLYNPTAGTWYVVISLGDGTGPFEYRRGVWSLGWTVYPADFNGDGATDLFIYRSENGYWYRVMNNGAGWFSYTSGVWAPNIDFFPGDFDGDGRGDLFAYYSQTGYWGVLFSTTDGFRPASGRNGPGLTVRVADFNGDRAADLFFLDVDRGSWSRWIGRGDGTFAEYNGGWSAGWRVSTSDFNADGMADLLIHRPATGDWYQVISTPNPALFDLRPR